MQSLKSVKCFFDAENGCTSLDLVLVVMQFLLFDCPPLIGAANLPCVVFYSRVVVFLYLCASIPAINDSK